MELCHYTQPQVTAGLVADAPAVDKSLSFQQGSAEGSFIPLCLRLLLGMRQCLVIRELLPEHSYRL